MLKPLAFVVLCLFGAVQAAGAQEAQPSQPSRIGKFLKLQPDPVEPAPFVKESRPGKLDYVPVHEPRPQPSGTPLTREQLKAKEAELDRVRASHDQLAGRAATKQAFKPLAQEPKPKRQARTKCIGYCLAKGTILPGR